MAFVPPVGPNDLARLDRTLMRFGLRVGLPQAERRPTAIHEVITGRPLDIALYIWPLRTLADRHGRMPLARAKQRRTPLGWCQPRVLVLAYDRTRDVYVLWLPDDDDPIAPSELAVDTADLDGGAETGLAVSSGGDRGPVVLHPALVARVLRSVDAGVPWHPDAVEGLRDLDGYELER